MFCDQQLAARIEAAEVGLLASACAHVRRRVPGTYTAAIGGGLAASIEPGSPLNKVAGLGFAPFDEAAWAAIVAEHDRRSAPIQVELSTLGDPAIGAFLTERGHRLVGIENVLGRTVADVGVGPDAAVGSGIDVAPYADRALWLDVMVEGFGTPDTQGVASHESFDRTVLERVIGDFAAADGVHLLLARRAGVPAGAAALRIDGGIAQLCGASTLPAHRRRGVQTALLRHRFAFAAARGAELCVMTTQPGSKSMQNGLRSGFVLLYSRCVLLRDARA